MTNKQLNHKQNTHEPSSLLNMAILQPYTPEDFNHVLWIGGSPCSGKSSITDLLAQRYGTQVYHVDDAFLQHLTEFNEDCYPINYKWTHTPWQDLCAQSPAVLMQEAIQAYTEHLQFIFPDLLKVNQLVIAEGTSLLPDYIAPLVNDSTKALWIVPSEDFQRKTYPKRGPFVTHVLDQCRDPDSAIKNWMDRDVAFARWVEDRTRQLQLRCIQVDGQLSIDQNTTLVEEYFKLGSGKN